MPEMSTADMEMQQAYDAVQYGAGNTLIVRFYRKMLLDEEKTHGWTEFKRNPESGIEFPIKHAAAGKNVYSDADWIEVRIPGNKDEIRDRPVRLPQDKLAFPKQWEAYQQGLSAPASGTPLTLIPGYSGPQLHDYASYGVKTAEQLVAVSDSDGQSFMDFNRAKKRAQEYLDRQAGAAPTEHLHAELEKRDKQLEDQGALIKQMQEQLAVLAKKK